MTEMEEELRPCTVCGQPVLWGTCHSNCGARVMAAKTQADAVLAEVAKWALAGHISDIGVTVEAGEAIRAVACGVTASSIPQDVKDRMVQHIMNPDGVPMVHPSVRGRISE